MTMPAGKYYVGDLCYVLKTSWDEVCDIIIKDREVLDGEFYVRGDKKFAVYSTMYGDGHYYDNASKGYYVDSGSIGCIRIDDIPDMTDDILQNIKKLGQVVEFESQFVTQRFADGTICFGDLEIYTGYDSYGD